MATEQGQKLRQGADDEQGSGLRDVEGDEMDVIGLGAASRVLRLALGRL